VCECFAVLVCEYYVKVSVYVGECNEKEKQKDECYCVACVCYVR